MKTLKKETEERYLIETYFGIGLGWTRIDGKTLIILPFFIVLITPTEIYK